MANVLVSVVIPAYNYASTLPRAVNSVLAQLTENVSELLVIDDGSTDATPEVLERLGLEHAGRFRMLRKPNGGVSSARNMGIKEAQGQFLIFLDADDEMAEGALQAVRQHIAENPDSRMIIGAHWSAFEDGHRSLSAPKSLPLGPLARVRGYLLDKTLALSNGACVMHREVFAPGLYPQHLPSVEDIPVFAQVLARFPCSVLAQPLVIVHKHSDSMRHDLKRALTSGTRVVDEVFTSERMPAQLQCLRQLFLAQRCLSLFRTCYAAGDYANARAFYRQAIRADWRALTRWSYTRKAVQLLFK
jgi:glycosyltransferase involved in cell wall biosynthesis